MQIIARRAAADDIVQDVTTAHRNATAQGGNIAKLAGEKLGPVLAVESSLKTQITALDGEVSVALSALAALDNRADAVIGHVADDYWNAIGRPQQDVMYSLIFPGGIAVYTTGSNFDQPDRMDLLVELLGTIRHPALSDEQSKSFHDRIAAEAITYREQAVPLRAKIRKLEHFQHVYVVLAKLAQGQLARFKKSLEAEGVTDARLKDIIPSRSTPRAAKPLEDTDKIVDKDSGKTPSP